MDFPGDNYNRFECTVNNQCIRPLSLTEMLHCSITNNLKENYLYVNRAYETNVLLFILLADDLSSLQKYLKITRVWTLYLGDFLGKSFNLKSIVKKWSH